MALSPTIIYKDKEFLVIDKPAGFMVHAARKATAPTLTDWLVRRFPEVKKVGDDPAVRPGIVHRLDRETSGVMVVPRTQAMFEYLKSQFQKHAVKKTYLAIVRGIPRKEHDVIDLPIGIRSGTLKRSTRSKKNAKEAVTEYEVVERFPGPYSLVKASPRTGRTHQIRVHLAGIGHPIAGDVLYGGKAQPVFAVRTLLHAASLEFLGKDGTRFVFDAPLPPDFRKALEALKNKELST